MPPLRDTRTRAPCFLPTTRPASAASPPRHPRKRATSLPGAEGWATKGKGQVEAAATVQGGREPGVGDPGPCPSAALGRGNRERQGEHAGDTPILLARCLSRPGLLGWLKQQNRSSSQFWWEVREPGAVGPVLSEAEGGPGPALLLAGGPGISLGRSTPSLLGAACVPCPGFMRTPVVRAWPPLPGDLLLTHPLCKDSIPKQGRLLRNWGWDSYAQISKEAVNPVNLLCACLVLMGFCFLKSISSPQNTFSKLESRPSFGFSFVAQRPEGNSQVQDRGRA